MAARRNLQTSPADTEPAPRAPRRAYAQAPEEGRDIEALLAIAENDEITQLKGGSENGPYANPAERP